ncbi:hypothetical protein BFP97_01180 [Roseivirga sp. 4D4]|uniref:hypothetical protein n=1 Tax=Roseivirga sp. 4D4 TaxID=1889784 RepID=UPI0008533E85|nr:hypothetical protein [Roseivirga sp. 4D4]OEK00207.1 hypothetical protein BFP97_01180 [Roseivirga sp. 4D4]
MKEELITDKMTLGQLFKGLTIKNIVSMSSVLIAIISTSFYLGSKYPELSRDTVNLENITSGNNLEQYKGVWIYEIQNETLDFEVFAVLEIRFDQNSQEFVSNGKVWKKGKEPTVSNYDAVWDSDGIFINKQKMNLIFDLRSKNNFDSNENSNPSNYEGIIRISLTNDENSLDGRVYDLEPNSAVGSFSAIRSHSKNLNSAIIESYNTFGK